MPDGSVHLAHRLSERSRSNSAGAPQPAMPSVPPIAAMPADRGSGSLGGSAGASLQSSPQLTAASLLQHEELHASLLPPPLALPPRVPHGAVAASATAAVPTSAPASSFTSEVRAMSCTEVTDRRGARKRYFTKEEVQRHCTVDDVWLVCRGRVYDATPFVRRHPGGLNSILRRAGGDASRDFDFHSRGAQAQWNKLFIGYLKPETQPNQCTIS